jgi:hypothetical protein
MLRVAKPPRSAQRGNLAQAAGRETLPRDPAADREMPALPSSIAPMIGAITGLILLVVLLGVLFYCAQMLLPLISPALQILIILLVAIVALYVIVVLLGFAGIHVPVPGFR